MILQAADCKASLSLTDNAKLKTTNPIKKKDEVLDGNDGTNSKDPAKTDDTKTDDSSKTDDSKTDDTKTDDASKTDDTKTDDASKADDSKTDDSKAGGRRLEGDAAKDDSKPLITAPPLTSTDKTLLTTTNPDDYYLP